MGCVHSKGKWVEVVQAPNSRKTSYGGDGPTPEVVYHFKECGPTVEGGVAKPCLSNTAEVFMVEKDGQRYLYNDMFDQDVQITLQMHPPQELKTPDGGTTPSEGQPSPAARSAGGDRTMVLSVGPGKTVPLRLVAGEGVEIVEETLSLNHDVALQLQAYQRRVDAEARRNRSFCQSAAGVPSPGTSRGAPKPSPTLPGSYHADSIDDVTVARCVEKDCLFVDQEFPPQAQSLQRDCDKTELRPRPWMRPRTYLCDSKKKEARLFSERGQVAVDVQQGSLGDCYWVAATSCLTQIPGAVQALFRHPQGDAVAKAEQNIGAYRVWLNDKGWWRQVLIDDYLPCTQVGPCFGQNKTEEELWVGLLEKAYAKLHGSYASIIGGLPSTAWSDLTGCASADFDLDKSTETFDTMLGYTEAQLPQGLSTPMKPKGWVEEKAAGAGDVVARGLVFNHAYSVLAVRRFSRGKRGELRLLQIRNPWGAKGWTGPWGPGSEKWRRHPDVAAECPGSTGPAEDGVFWMEWSDVVERFQMRHVCFSRPSSWFDYRVKGEFTNGIPNVVLEVTVLGSNEAVKSQAILSLPAFDRIELAVYKGDGKGHYHAAAFATNSPDKPAEPSPQQQKNQHGHRIGVQFSFDSSDAPYLIVPRTGSYTKPTPFVLGLLTSKAVEEGVLSVTFRRLAPEAFTANFYRHSIPQSLVKPGVLKQPAQEGRLPNGVVETVPEAAGFRSPAGSVVGLRTLPHGVPTEPGAWEQVEQGSTLYQLRKNGTLFHYNGSRRFLWSVQLEFGPESDVTALGNTTKTAGSADGNRWGRLELSVAPGSTEPFFHGTLNGSRKISESTDAAELTPEALKRYSDTLQEERRVIGTLQASNPDDTVARCVEKDCLFVDQEFPPEARSVRGEESMPHDELQPVLWMRPRTYLCDSKKKEARLFSERGQVAVVDVHQGSLGNCYWVAATSCLTQIPGAVQALFQHPRGDAVAKAEQNIGAYRVWLNDKGWWRQVLIDDYLPCTQVGPCFGRNKTEEELWVGLLEKAYAKLHGSYALTVARIRAVTESSRCADAFVALTGLPTYPLESLNAPKQFEDLQSYWTCGAMVRLGTLEDGSPLVKKQHVSAASDHAARGTLVCTKTETSDGIILRHSYCLLDIKEFPASKLRLLQIRNPWGTHVWTGPWGPGSEKWQLHPDVAAECPGSTGPAKDGVFWMEWSDVVKYFDHGTVCFSRPSSWFDYRVKGEFTNGIPNVVLEVTVLGSNEAVKDAMITLSCPQGEDKGLRLAVYRSNGPDGDFEPGLRSTNNPTAPSGNPKLEGRSMVGMSCSFFERSPAKYLVVPQTEKGRNGNRTTFVLGLLSPMAVQSNKLSVRFRQLKPDCTAFNAGKPSSFKQSSVLADFVSRPTQVKKCEGGGVETMQKSTGFGNVE